MPSPAFRQMETSNITLEDMIVYIFHSGLFLKPVVWNSFTVSFQLC